MTRDLQSLGKTAPAHLTITYTSGIKLSPTEFQVAISLHRTDNLQQKFGDAFNTLGICNPSKHTSDFEGGHRGRRAHHKDTSRTLSSLQSTLSVLSGIAKWDARTCSHTSKLAAATVVAIWLTLYGNLVESLSDLLHCNEEVRITQDQLRAQDHLRQTLKLFEGYRKSTRTTQIVAYLRTRGLEPRAISTIDQAIADAIGELVGLSKPDGDPAGETIMKKNELLPSSSRRSTRNRSMQDSGVSLSKLEFCLTCQKRNENPVAKDIGKILTVHKT